MNLYTRTCIIDIVLTITITITINIRIASRDSLILALKQLSIDYRNFETETQAKAKYAMTDYYDTKNDFARKVNILESVIATKSGATLGFMNTGGVQE